MEITKTQQLVIENENLVYDIIHKRFRGNLDYVDIGWIGLIKAANTFDQSRGAKFSTYAYRIVFNEICMEIRKQVSRSNVLNCVSLDLQINNFTLNEMIPSSFNLQESVENRDILENIKNILTEKEYDILCKTYGLFGRNQLNQVQIANQYSVTQSYICRIIQKAMSKLKEVYCENIC